MVTPDEFEDVAEETPVDTTDAEDLTEGTEVYEDAEASEDDPEELVLDPDSGAAADAVPAGDDDFFVDPNDIVDSLED